MAQQESKLGMLAAIARKSNIVKNGFNGESDANNYSATHTKAMSDQETPIQGKGTGIYLDTYNGNPMYAGSGRLAAIANNTSKWGYGPSSPYTAPDTGNPSSPSGGVV